MCESIWKAACLLLVFSLFSFLPADAQMRQIHQETNPDNPLYKLSFVSASSGFAAFENGIGYTADSGRTFQMRPITFGNVDFGNFDVDPTLNFRIRGVKAFNNNSILVYGHYSLVPTILFSNNGGLNYWVVFYSRYNPMELPGSIRDIVFPANGSTGFAVDYDRIIKTNNNGLNWTVTGVFPGKDFQKIYAPDANNIFAQAYNSGAPIVYKSTNGGTSWSTLNLPVNANATLTSLFFLDINTGWISMSNNANNGSSNLFYKTINGGQNWTLQNNPEVPQIAGGFVFTDQQTGYAFGEGSWQLVKTKNAGANWEIIPRDNNFSYLLYGFNDMQLLSSQLWAGGGHGFIELNTNLNGPTIPRAYFKFDTTGVAATGTVSLLNLSSANNYQYQWYVNGQAFNTGFNTTYQHINSNTLDSVKLVVSNGVYKDSVTRYQWFVPAPQPPVTTITSFTPDTGYVYTQVTITGTNFSGISNVYFGAVPATSFSVLSATEIRASVGMGASGNITVTSQYNTATKPGFVFVPRLYISSFSPHSGPAGTVVTINGTAFSHIPQQNLVFFGTQPATVLSATGTQLQVLVPANAGTNFITVNVNGNNAATTQKFILTFPGQCDLYTHSFLPEKTFPTMQELPMQMKICDFDNDGRIDIVHASENASYGLMILKNNSLPGVVQFDSVLRVPLNSHTYHYLLNDMNNDGKTDILASDVDKLYFFRNTSIPGSISFAAKVLVPVSSQPGSFFKLGDLDNDGLPELIGAGKIIRNNSSNGNISFTGGAVNLPGEGITELGDYDGDGRLDISSKTTIYRNTSVNSTIQFSSFTLPTFGEYYRVAFTSGDFDSDGKDDIALATYFSDDPGELDTVYIYKNLSTPGMISFSKWQSVPVHFRDEFDVPMINADMNGDGKAEILMGIWEPDRAIYILQNASSPGNPNFNLPVEVGLEQRPHVASVAVADFDNDGKPDIAAPHSSANPYRQVIGIYRSNLCGASFINFCPGATVSINSNITGGTYQWQIFNGSSFVDLANNSSYSGVNNATLNIQNTPASFNANQYRCRVNSSTNSFTYELKYVNKWTGSVNQFWNNAQNWSCGVVPNEYANVELSQNAVVVVNANAQCYSLTVTPGANISVNSGVQLTVYH